MFLVWVIHSLFAWYRLLQKPSNEVKKSNSFIKGKTKKRDYQNFYIFAANLKQKHYVQGIGKPFQKPS